MPPLNVDAWNVCFGGADWNFRVESPCINTHAHADRLTERPSADPRWIIIVYVNVFVISIYSVELYGRISSPLDGSVKTNLHTFLSIVPAEG